MMSIRFSNTSLFSMNESITLLMFWKKLHSFSRILSSSFSVSNISILVNSDNNGFVILSYFCSLISFANNSAIFNCRILHSLYILELKTSIFDAIFRARDGIGFKSLSSSLYSVFNNSFKKELILSRLTWLLSFMSANMISFNTFRDINLWSRYSVFSFRMKMLKMGRRFSQMGLMSKMIMYVLLAIDSKIEKRWALYSLVSSRLCDASKRLDRCCIK
mmetsp:Transcript_45328/g.38176  ORF Transcript_45328/g.38176 Transcript_45328/m.38176 type:complete len:218 (-) Transcript_45328:23-676(-)